MILNIQENLDDDEFFEVLNSPGEYRARYFEALQKEMSYPAPTAAIGATTDTRVVDNFDIQSFENQAEMARRRFYNAIHHRKNNGNFKINIINKARFSRKNPQDETKIEVNFNEISSVTGILFKPAAGEFIF